jgi:hypothetical protein
MKAFQKVLLVAVVSFAALFACKKDNPVDPCADFNFQTSLQSETNALTAAATAYGMNPTTENCNAYRNAFQTYLNAASDLQDCANKSGQGEEFQQAINNAQASLDSLQC